MQTSTASPVTNFTSNTITSTKSQDQILTQSSGAMIAIIVIGIIIILTILLVILKTYNRRTHASRVLGGASKAPRQKKMSSSTVQTNLPLGSLGAASISSSSHQSNSASQNGLRLPRAELNSTEQQSTASGSTVVTIHSPTLENT